jgi:hypothetical protein
MVVTRQSVTVIDAPGAAPAPVTVHFPLLPLAKVKVSRVNTPFVNVNDPDVAPVAVAATA